MLAVLAGVVNFWRKTLNLMINAVLWDSTLLLVLLRQTRQ